MRRLDTDIHGLYRLMRLQAEAHPFDPTPPNLVDEACAQQVSINGHMYNFCFSLNVVHVPRFKWIRLLLPGTYITAKFWHLTVTGRTRYPNDDFMAQILPAFFPGPGEIRETTFEALQLCREVLSPEEYIKMLNYQRQFTQFIPNKLTV